MSKLSITTTSVLALVALSMASIAAGLWFTRNPDMSQQVAVLEAKVRENETVIAGLRKQLSSANRPHVTGAAGASEIAAGNSDMFAAKGGQQGTLGSATKGAPPTAAEAAAATAAVAGTTPVVKSDKRLAQAEARYADLINQFGLASDEKEAFKALAAQRDDIRKDTFSKLSDPSLTAAQRQAILADAKAQVGQVDDSVRQFLNNDGDYNTFQKWEAQNIERTQMDDARAIFDKNGVPLSPEQETTLMDQAYGLRTNNQGLGDPYSADTLAGRRIDQNYIASALAKFDSDTAILVQGARSYMSPQQILSFQAVRYQQRVQLESRLWGMARTTAQ